MSHATREKFDAQRQSTTESTTKTLNKRARKSAFSHVAPDELSKTHHNGSDRAGDIPGTPTEFQRHVLAQIGAMGRVRNGAVSPEDMGTIFTHEPGDRIHETLDELVTRGWIKERHDTGHWFALTPVGNRLALGLDLQDDHGQTCDAYIAEELDQRQRAQAADHEDLVAATVAELGGRRS